MSETGQPREVSTTMMGLGHEFGFTNMLASTVVARCAIRWQILHRRPQHQDLLPPHLSGTNGERRESPLLSNRGGRRGGGLSPMFTLPAGMLAWYASVD